MTDILRFHFVRHVPVHNPEGVWYGRNIAFDTTSPHIIGYFNQLATELPHNRETSVWVSSDYPRAEATAQGARNALSSAVRPDIIIDSAFIEQQYGAMEDRKHSDIKNDPRVAPYLNDMWGTAPEGGESMQMLQNRVATGLTKYVDELPAAKTDVVIFSHGGVIMAAFAHAVDKRMVDVFRNRGDALIPSFSYMSKLEIGYDREQGKWLQAYEYQSGIRKRDI